MEWTLEKLLQFSPLLVAGALPAYIYWRNRKDKQELEEKDVKLELTSEILSDGSTIRKDLRQMLKEEQNRYDKVVTIVEQLRDEIIDLKSLVNDFRAEVKELKFVNNTQAVDKKKLEEENEKLRAEKILLQNEIKDLRARGGGFRNAGENLIERERSGE